jgi:thiol-disulfide isomerase/thioredoxin
VIVYFWALWCAPCRAMAPAFKQVSQKYQGQVDALKINADESPEVLKILGVKGIPTVSGFAGGREIMRRTGMQSAEVLDILFDAALHQRKPAVVPPASIPRWIRFAAGLVVIALGRYFWQSIPFVIVGGILLFSAFYDRCPIYRAVVPRLATLFQLSRLRKPLKNSHGM